MNLEEPGPIQAVLHENMSRLAEARASANKLDGKPLASSYHQETIGGKYAVAGSTLGLREVSEELSQVILVIRGIGVGNFESEVEETSGRAENSWFQKWWNRLVAKPAKVLGYSFFISLIPGFGPAICFFLSHQQVYAKLKDLKIGRVAQSALRERVMKRMVIDLVVGLMFPIIGSVYRRLSQKNHAHVSHATQLVENHVRRCEVLFTRHKDIFSLQSQALPTAASSPVPGWTQGHYATPPLLSLPPAAISDDYAEVDESYEYAISLEGVPAASLVRNEYLQREARHMWIHKRDDFASNIAASEVPDATVAAPVDEDTGASSFSVSSRVTGVPADTSDMLPLPTLDIHAITPESGSRVSPMPQPQVEDFSTTTPLPAIRPRLIRTHASHGNLPTLSNTYAIPVAHHVPQNDAANSMAPLESFHGRASTPMRPASIHSYHASQGDDLPGPITISSFIENADSHCYNSDEQDENYDERDDSALEALKVALKHLLQELKDCRDDEGDDSCLVDSDSEDHELQSLITEPPLDHPIHFTAVEENKVTPEVSAITEEGYSTALPSKIVGDSSPSIHYSTGSAGAASSLPLTTSLEGHHFPTSSSPSSSLSPSHTLSPHSFYSASLPPLLPLGDRQIQPPKSLAELCDSRWKSQHVRSSSPTLIVANEKHTNSIANYPRTCSPGPVCLLRYLSRENQSAYPSEVANRIRRDLLSNDGLGLNCALLLPDCVGHETQGEESNMGESTVESASSDGLRCILRPLDHRWRIEVPSVLTRIMDEAQSFTDPADATASLSTWHSTMETDDGIHSHVQPRFHPRENGAEQEYIQSLEDISSYLQPKFDDDSDEQPQPRQQICQEHEPLGELEAAGNDAGEAKASDGDRGGEGDEDQRDGGDEHQDNGWNGDGGNVSAVDDMMSDDDDIEASFNLLRTYQTRPTLQDRLLYELNKRTILREWRPED
ncbi:hypothetical protein EDD21DRAFT_416725 [Dissophora ornata]|nr:hypothetical protein EDD21DRAFT_416725 [Dissophora ornata]